MSEELKPSRQQVVDRLRDLLNAITARDYGERLERETLMHIPARPTEDMDCIVAEAIKLLDTRPAPDAELVDCLTEIYNSGYNAGHKDTVESCYTHVLPVDYKTYHRDIVEETLKDMPELSTQPDQVSDEWKQAVIDKLIACCIFSTEHEKDARKAVNDLITYEVLLALDPQISEDADALLHKNPPGKVSVSRECALVAKNVLKHQAQKATLVFVDSETVHRAYEEFDQALGQGGEQ